MQSPLIPIVPDVSVRYTLDGVAFLLQTHRNTITQWANGYTQQMRNGARVQKPGILRTDRSQPTLFNYWELIELLFVRELVRRDRVEPTGNKIKQWATLQQVRDMAEFLSGHLGEYPLARADLKRVGGQIATNQVDGANLFTNPILMQHLLEFVEDFEQHLVFDRESQLVTTWFPMEDHMVRVDPNYRFGQPIIPSGIPAEIVYKRFLLEDSDVDDTAEWFEIPNAEVEAAVRFEEAWQSKMAA